MRPRYYVHMGPRTADRVSLLWKGLHVTLFISILISASIATWCIYKILDMYNFHCILYAKITFEDSYEERMRKNASIIEGVESFEDNNSIFIIEEEIVTPNCTEDPEHPDCLGKRRRNLEKNPKKSKIDWRSYRAYSQNLSFLPKHNNTGFLNLRKTAFATIYMCDLMFFSPLASLIMSVFLGSLTIVGGKGGAGNPGDLFPNPWICVYPFLGLCGFMIVFSFIAQNLFFNGLNTFCGKYYSLTKKQKCSKEMDAYTKQFTNEHRGEPKFFYYNYLVGGIAVEITSALWVLQALVYIFRILCLADFTTYLTRIRLVDDKKNLGDPKMTNVVIKAVDQAKVKNI